MLAVWDCRFRNQAPIGSYLDPTFSFTVRPTISRKLLSAFDKRDIHRLKILPHVTSCIRHQRQKRLKHLPGSNWTENASSVVDRTSGQGELLVLTLRPLITFRCGSLLSGAGAC